MDRFKTFDEANEFAKALRGKGYHAWIEHFHDYDGCFYVVITWRDAK